jgi:predicted enzyme related to lactoylglutathione lyase
MPSSIIAGAVVFAVDTARVSAFYSQVLGLSVAHADHDHVVLEADSFQLVVHALPAPIAVSIEIADPPHRREDAAVKLIFLVPSLSKARMLAARLGGELSSTEHEWLFQTYRVCDGHDPEGNVIQLREQAFQPVPRVDPL